MKLFSTIATAAVVGSFLNVATPSSASVYVDLDAGMRAEFDDSNDTVLIKKGSETRIMRNVKAAYRPIPAEMVSKIKSDLNRRGVKSFSTGKSGNDVIRVGISGGGNIFAFRGITGSLKQSLLKQYEYLDALDVGHWTIYSLVQ
jgi:hypothetical protein